MGALKGFVIGLVVLVAVLIGVGFFLPSQYEVTRSIDIRSQASHVYPFVANLKNWKDWGVWYDRDPAMQVTYTGSPSDIGFKTAWKSESQGNGEMTLTQLQPNTMVGYDLYFPDMQMGSKGVITFAENDGVTTVTWTDAGDVGDDILGRYFVLFIDGMIGPDFEAGLAKLKKLAEQ